MKDKQEFFALLTELDGQDVGECARLIGDFDFGRYVLKANRAAADAAPTEVLFPVRVPQTVAGFPHPLFHTPVRRTALEDYLTRRAADLIEQYARFDEEGVARRRVSIAAPGQKILPRSSVVVMDEYVEARLLVQLPSRGGRILGDAAKEIFLNEFPAIVNSALLYCNLDGRDLEEFIDLMESADHVRQALPTRGLISFVREGSLVARRGQSDLPDPTFAGGLQVAEGDRVEMDTPHAGNVKGLGISAGITVVIGDDYSGRSALLKAIASGIYNHVPGDGRELAITTPDAVYISAEKNRSVQRVGIGPFVQGDEEGGIFSATAADAVAAQAASLVEAIEVGARALILDESDSAPGFLAQDSRLASLGHQANSRVRPLAALARSLADELGVSLVIGGSAMAGEFVGVADTVLLIENQRVRNVTGEVKKLGLSAPVARGGAGVSKLAAASRWVVPSSIDASAGLVDARIEAPSTHLLRFGGYTIDLSGIVQLADVHQTATIGLILQYARMRYMEEGRPVREILDLMDRDMSTEGIEILSRDLRGDLARPRRYEIAAALNRLASLRISHTTE